MKGLYWLILGLCVWFLPYTIIQFMLSSEEPERSTSELLYTPPEWVVYIHFGIAFVIILKAVIVIRKERKASRNEDSRKNKKSKK